MNTLGSWLEMIDFFSSDDYANLQGFIESERAAGKSILPEDDDVLNAFKYLAFQDVKVVILGQDPYPNKRHAHGLAFSIPTSTSDIPKSLQNILKELEDDLGVGATSGNLSGWAEQGVLLLNRVLTVEEGMSNSHQGKGWEKLTGEAIKAINDHLNNVVFILWGNKAQSVLKLIDGERHRAITSPHPSPLSAYRGFFGSKPFSKANAYLEKCGRERVDWANTTGKAAAAIARSRDGLLGFIYK